MKNNVRNMYEEKEFMKKFSKRLLSWLCLMLMVISMVVPVMAEINPSIDAGILEGNYPIVTGISYKGTYADGVPSINKDTVPFAVGLTIRNNNPGIYTCKITSVELVYSDGKNDVSCQGECKFAHNEEIQTFYVNVKLITDNAAPGTYSLSKVILRGTNGKDSYTKVFEDVSSINGADYIKVKVNNSSKDDFGNISIGLSPDMTSKSMDVNLDNNNLSQKVQYYIKVTGKSGVKGITVFWGRYVDGELRETGNTTRVTKEGEGLYSSYCVLQSGSETGVYRMSKIKITDDNDMTYFFYNPAFKEYANKQNTFNADFVLNVNNSIDPDKLSLYCFGFVNEALDTMNQTITVKKVPRTKVLVPFRIETKAINNEISLKNVYFETVDSNGKVTDYQTVGALQKNVDYYDGKIMLIEDGWPAGKYKINKIKLISSDGKEYSYSVEDGSFTVNMGRNNTLIVKENDRIEPEETGVAPVSKPVEKSNDGTAKAEVKVDDKQELAVEKDDLDDAAKKCAEEEYTFNIESKAIPDNTTIEIGKVLAGNIYDNVKAAIESVVLDVKKDIRVFEINLLNTSGNKIQPDNNGNVTITTNIPDGFDPLKIEVYRLSDDGKDKIKVSAKAENGKVTFVTNHFSTYIIAQTAAQGQIIVPTPDPDDIWDTEDEENSVIIASEERPAGSATTIKDKSPVTSDSAPVVVLLLVFVSAVALFGMCVSKRIIK